MAIGADSSAIVDRKFRAWASSFSGCDGGNPDASIWISGIEWGYGKERGESDDEYEIKLLNYYKKGLRKDIEKGEAPRQGQYDWVAHNRYTFGQSVAKLYMAIHRRPVEQYSDISNILPEATIFKLNLYPIPFRYAHESLWDKYGLAETTGMETKEAYRTWCLVNRFPKISDMVTKYEPELIIGIGISYLNDYFVCFAGQSGCEKVSVEAVGGAGGTSDSGRRFYWALINGGRTILAVLPFFTSPKYGLNSNQLLQQVGGQLDALRARYLNVNHSAEPR